MDHRIEQRKKQIDLFKHSKTYLEYKDEKSPGKPFIPIPNIYNMERSKRSFDGLVKEWKARVYAWLEIKNIVQSQAYAFYIQYHDHVEEPDIFMPDVQQRVKIWKDLINRFYEDEYIFIPTQMCQYPECGNRAGFYEDSQYQRTFCSRSCQENFYSISTVLTD